MKQTINEILKDLVANIKTYINAKIDLLLLTTFEKTGKIFAFLLSSIILILISFFSLLFLTIALAVWLGSYLNNLPEGFIIVGIGYIILGLIFIIFRKSLIYKKILKHLLKVLFEFEKNHQI